MTMTPQKEEETALESTQESVEKASTPKETPTAEESEETHNGRDEENSKQPAVPHMPSYSSGVSFSSPPVINQSYPYYGPPYSAARTFNRSNHAMMATIKTFPEKLHQILDVAAQTGLADVISFFPHGRSFKVHKPNRFVCEIMPRFFKQTKLTSFQRQLNLYGFKRISKGVENGGYYHPMFIQGQPHLADQIKRQAQSKGGKQKKSTESSAPKPTPAAQPAYYMSSYNAFAHNTSATPSYYPPPAMVPPSSYATPYGYPPVYGGGWPVAPYGMHPAYTPISYGGPPSSGPAAPPTTSTETSTSTQDSQNSMPQVSPVISTPSSVSFTPIKLSAADNITWTPGALCLD